MSTSAPEYIFEVIEVASAAETLGAPRFEGLCCSDSGLIEKHEMLLRSREVWNLGEKLVGADESSNESKLWRS